MSDHENYHGNGWNQYQKLVLFRLDTIQEEQEKLTDKVEKLHTSVALLKLKIGLIGMGSSAIVAAVFHFIFG